MISKIEEGGLATGALLADSWAIKETSEKSTVELLLDLGVLLSEVEDCDAIIESVDSGLIFRVSWESDLSFINVGSLSSLLSPSQIGLVTIAETLNLDAFSEECFDV